MAAFFSTARSIKRTKTLQQFCLIIGAGWSAHRLCVQPKDRPARPYKEATMIRRISHGLLLSSVMLGSCAQAALPDNVLLQRDTLRSLTLMLQLQAEGMHSPQRKTLQQDMQQLQLLLDQAGQPSNGYPQTLTRTLNALDNGQAPATEELDRLHQQALSLLDGWHKPEADGPYLPLLMTDYLAMRYAFSSYIGNPSASAHKLDRYYTTSTNDLLLQLDQQLTNILTTRKDNSLSARWGLLHHALSDTHDGWTRTRSGKAFTPLMVIRHSRALSDELGQLLDNQDAVSSK